MKMLSVPSMFELAQNCFTPPLQRPLSTCLFHLSLHFDLASFSLCLSDHFPRQLAYPFGPLKTSTNVGHSPAHFSRPFTRSSHPSQHHRPFATSPLCHMIPRTIHTPPHPSLPATRHPRLIFSQRAIKGSLPCYESSAAKGRHPSVTIYESSLGGGRPLVSAIATS